MANISGGQVVWDVKVNLDQFTKGLSGVKTQMSNFAGSLDKTNSSFKLQGGILDGVGKKLAALAAGYLSFRAVSGIIQSSIDKFNAYEEAVTKLTTVVLNQSGATQENVRALMDQAEALSNVSTLSQEQIITGATVIATFDGMTTELTSKAIPAWINYTALQYGSINTTDEAKAAAESFGKAIVGSTQALTAQGFKFTDAQREMLKTGSSTERLALVIEAMGYAGDAAADQAGTLEGRMKILGNQFDNSRLAIGGVAQLLKVELLNAFISSSAGGAAWGDNMLSIAKQVANGFVGMANVAGQAIQGLLALANRAAVGVAGVKALGLQASAQYAQGQEGILGRIKGFVGRNIVGEDRSVDEINSEIEKVGNTVLQLDNRFTEIGQNSIDLQARLDGVKDRISGIGSVSDLMAISSKEAGSTLRDMGKEGAASGEDMKQAQEKMANAIEKVIDFRQKEMSSFDKIQDAMEKQRTKLIDLKIEYEKAVASIKRSLEDLDASFNKSETSARESFLSSVASAAETARQTIKDREEAIQTEQNQATPDQAKIAALQALNEKERAILENNASLIEEADKIEAEKKTAVGVQNLINRFNAEREEARKNFEREKSELQSQLAEKEAEYKKSQEVIKKDTLLAIADIRTAYIKMFDDLQRELSKLGESFLNLMKLGAISAPGPSKAAEAAFASLTKNIPKRALGGPVEANRPYMVGEKGPEIIVPQRSGTVIPNAGANINFYVSEKADWHYGLELIKRELGMSGLRANAGISS